MTHPSERKAPYQLPNWYVLGGMDKKGGRGNGTAVTRKAESILPPSQRTPLPSYIPDGNRPGVEPTTPLTEEERTKLTQMGSLLLTQLLDISDRFLVLEELNQFEKRGITSFRTTPYVTVKNYPYPMAIVSTQMLAHWIPPDKADVFGPHRASAGIFAQLSETEVVTLFEISREEDIEGNTTCIMITSADKFFASTNQQEDITPNPLHSVKEATRVADLLEAKLAPLTPKPDHLLVVIDGKNRIQKFVIPHRSTG